MDQGYSRELELPQRAEDDPFWQDSVCMWFHDAERGVGGFFRIGRHPYNGVGRIHIFAFCDDGRRFRRYQDGVPLATSYLSQDGFRVAAGRYEVPSPNTLVFAWDEADCAAHLTFEDFYVPRDWGHSAYSQRTHTGGHLEVSGRLHGSLRIGADTFAVDGLAHRDHSWGLRRVRAMGSHRLVTGTTGPGFSFATLIVQWREQAEPTKMGFIVRDGVDENIADIDVVTGIDIDGITVRSGTCRLLMHSGEEIEIVARAHAGQLTEYENLYSSDNICTVDVGGLPGFCDFEITNNPLYGGDRPAYFRGVTATDGLHLPVARESM